MSDKKEPRQVRIELFLAPHNAKLLLKALRAGSRELVLAPEERTTMRFIDEAVTSQCLLQGVQR